MGCLLKVEYVFCCCCFANKLLLTAQVWNGKIKIHKHIHFDARLTSCLPVKCPSQLTKHPEPAPPVAQRVSALFLPLYHCSVR